MIHPRNGRDLLCCNRVHSLTKTVDAFGLTDGQGFRLQNAVPSVGVWRWDSLASLPKPSQSVYGMGALLVVSADFLIVQDMVVTDVGEVL